MVAEINDLLAGAYFRDTLLITIELTNLEPLEITKFFESIKSSSVEKYEVILESIMEGFSCGNKFTDSTGPAAKTMYFAEYLS